MLFVLVEHQGMLIQEEVVVYSAYVRVKHAFMNVGIQIFVLDAPFILVVRVVVVLILFLDLLPKYHIMVPVKYVLFPLRLSEFKL